MAATKFLSEQELKFVFAYQGNATDAARAAGFKSPKVAGCRLMKRAPVVKALEQKQQTMVKEAGKETAKLLGMMPDEVLGRLGQIARKGPDKRGSFDSQNDALEKLLKVYRMYPQESTEGAKRYADGTVEIYRSKWLSEPAPLPPLPAPAEA